MDPHLATIRSAFADPISYDPPSKWASDRPMVAVYSNEAAPDAMGVGNTARRVSFEIAYSDMVERPAKNGDVIGHATGQYRVIQITDLDDVAAWIVVVERAP